MKKLSLILSVLIFICGAHFTAGAADWTVTKASTAMTAYATPIVLCAKPCRLLGNFMFDTVASGETYIINVTAKRAQYDPQVISVTDNVSDLNFKPQQ
jgi:hypothetical protein